LLRKRLADSGREALHQQALKHFSALLVRDCKLLLRKRLADSGGKALHQQESPDAVHQGFLVVARERLELSASGL